MIRCCPAQLLCVLLALPVPVPASGKPSNQEKAPTIQQQIVLLPAGTIVEVKTKWKEKFTGRLGALTASSFEVQIAQGKGVKNQPIAFDEVKSVKVLSNHPGMSGGARFGLGVLAGIGILIGLGFALSIAGCC